MPLVRAFSKVDEQGKVPIPKQILIQANLKTGQLVEIKVTGTTKAKNLLISQREDFR